MASLRNSHITDTASGLSPVKRKRTDYVIRKVILALNILEQFCDEVDEFSLTELSKRLSMSDGNVQQLLLTLKSRNYVEQDAATKKYRLGFKNLELAQALLRQTDLYRISRPVLTRIYGACSENTAVSVMKKSHVIELDAIQSELPVQVVSRVGVHLPAHCVAAGKMLIASLPHSEQEKLLDALELKRYTNTTITSAVEFASVLGRILDQGFAIDNGELDYEVRSVAAVIRDYTGLPVGAVAVTGPSCRISLERLTGELAALVQKGASEISAKLGFRKLLQ